MALKRTKMLAYGLAEFPMAMAAIPMAIFIPALYTRDLGLSLGAVGTILIIARWTDVLTDPVIGFLSDRTRSRWGRRRPWILLGAPIMLLSIVQLFTPQPNVTTIYFAGWTITLWLGWTLVAIPYYAWGAELSADYHERTRIATWRTLCGVGGTLTTIAAPLLSAQLFGYGNALGESLTIVAGAAVAVAIVGFILLLTRVPEPPPMEVRRIAIMDGFRLMWRNGPFKRLMIAFVLGGIGPAMAAPLYIFYVNHVIQFDLAASMILLVFYTGNLLGVLLWGTLAQRVGKRRAWMTGMSLMIFSQPFYLLLGPGDLIPMMCILFVGGLSAGSFVALPSAMKADVIDIDRLQSGEDRTGLFFSSWSLAQKAIVAWATGFALLILEFADFQPSGENGPTQIWALKMAFAGIPTLCYAAAVLVIRPYPITEERHALVLKQLAARSA
jgi:glycoside/pentoside/hexuronide:cation symporter, GPH family